MMRIRFDLNVTVSVPQLEQLGAQLMATFTDLQSHAQALQTSVHDILAGLGAVRAELHALRDQVAQGGLVTQEELDSLDATIQTTEAEAQDILGQTEAGL